MAREAELHRRWPAFRLDGKFFLIRGEETDTSNSPGLILGVVKRKMKSSGEF